MSGTGPLTLKEQVLRRGAYALREFFGTEHGARIAAAMVVEAVGAVETLEALTELVETLQREAPGTPLNNHRFDALGIKAHAAIAKARGQ